jgi:hypothetical protein
LSWQGHCSIVVAICLCQSIVRTAREQYRFRSSFALSSSTHTRRHLHPFLSVISCVSLPLSARLCVAIGRLPVSMMTFWKASSFASLLRFCLPSRRRGETSCNGMPSKSHAIRKRLIFQQPGNGNVEDRSAIRVNSFIKHNALADSHEWNCESIVGMCAFDARRANGLAVVAGAGAN